MFDQYSTVIVYKCVVVLDHRAISKDIWPMNLYLQDFNDWMYNRKLTPPNIVAMLCGVFTVSEQYRRCVIFEICQEYSYLNFFKTS